MQVLRKRQLAHGRRVGGRTGGQDGKHELVARRQSWLPRVVTSCGYPVLPVGRVGYLVCAHVQVRTPERAAPGMAAAVTEAGEASRESASKSKGAGGGMDLMADLRARLNRRRSGIGGADAQVPPLTPPPSTSTSTLCPIHKILNSAHLSLGRRGSLRRS
jgi:hypothetical protein